MRPDAFRFAIDRGGTFTDIFAQVPGEPGFRILKLLSEDPANYDDAPREGIRRIIEEVTGERIERASMIDTSRIEWIRMGTTVATNALLERKGRRCVLVTTRGFADVLAIGNQSRPRIFDLVIRKPEQLYERVVEVDERVRVVTDANEDAVLGDAAVQRTLVGRTGETVHVLESLDEVATRAQLAAARAAGISSVAVCLLHAYCFDEHERRVAQIARELGFDHISLSSELMPAVGYVGRGHTACVDAYLTPLVRDYVASFRSGFAGELRDARVEFMQSDGGLTAADRFSGVRAILSGPAGGVVGYALTTYGREENRAVIGFDMGGTSTDVSRFGGTFDHVFETEVAGVFVQAPQLDINTVAAGGGSLLEFHTGLYSVGPESAGANPGPVCYRKGGKLAVTDANVCLGRVQPEFFPHIFGADERQPLDIDASVRAMQRVADQVNAFYAAQSEAEGKPAPRPLSVDEVAFGFVQVANEAMCRPIRSLTEAKGHDVRDHVLACFGGAGGQHACAIARSLGIAVVYVHRFSGVLSAYGLALADVVEDAQEPFTAPLCDETIAEAHARLVVLERDARARLLADHVGGSAAGDAAAMSAQWFLSLRYEGTNTSVMVERSAASSYRERFEELYRKEYGFVMQRRGVLIDCVRVRVTWRASAMSTARIAAHIGEPAPLGTRSVYFDGGRVPNTPFFRLADLGAGARVLGPAVIVDETITVVVEPQCVATITDTGDIRIAVPQSASGTPADASESAPVDAVQLSIFSHRFMSIAEQMGRALQRTAVSTNIKERLDFSCAIFADDGSLVANAPHLPVHLGAMQDAVRFQLRHLGADWHEGEVILSNHPSAGGSHLPDITVITPVYVGGRPVFYVANRGHHADVGGLTPGSMPPHSRTLADEGAAILSFKLVRGGVFQEDGVAAQLAGTRLLRDNLSDLKAQVSANQKGIRLMAELIDTCGLGVVMAYMHHIRHNARHAVSDMLRTIARRYHCGVDRPLEAADQMDDGTPIRLRVTIDEERGTAVLDFTGTGHEVLGNCNAPRAVTYSAVIYSLRCLVAQDIPLNQGCLDPVTIVIPPQSILDPSPTAAVVGGNVLTSQRVTDVVLRAFRASAASQGCMNNFTFGNDRMGYYETIAGGAGAGPTWHGASAVQVHMTNTRITDVEVIERRYPVRMRLFAVRRGSGGAGTFHGGDGVVREFEFLQHLQGGGDALRGENLLLRADGRVINMTGKNTAPVAPGDRVRILTPGGGGWGAVAAARE